MGADKKNVYRVLSSKATLPGKDKQTSWVTVTREGSFSDPRYGKFEITHDMLLSMVRNFDQKVIGQEVFLDVNHDFAKGAAAKIIKLSIEGSRLRALVEWTDYGLEAVQKRGFVYLSAEFCDNWQDNEAGACHGATLLGAGLTVRPVIKRLDPITLSCEADGDVFILAELAESILKNARANMEAIEKLKKKLSELKYTEPVINEVIQLAELSITEDMPQEKTDKIVSSLLGTAKKLSEPAAPISQQNNTSVNTTNNPSDNTSNNPGGKTSSAQQANNPVMLSEAQIASIVAKQLAEVKKEEEEKQQSQAKAEKLLTEEINKVDGLPDDMKKQLSEEGISLLSRDMTETQIKALAQHQITHGQSLIAARTLSSMGYQVAGTPNITVPDNSVKQLSEYYHNHLKRADNACNLALDAKPTVFISKILSEYDRRFAPELAEEHKKLSSSGTSMTNTTLPYGVVREVIRESLHDLNVLNLVRTLTDFTAQQTTQIPYEKRQTTEIVNSGIVSEGQPIPSAGVEQRMDMAYVTQMKLALSVTNEVIHFTRSSMINWDALARNIEVNARIMRELVARRIINEIQRAADSYMACDVLSEAVTVDADTGMLCTKNWPIVRPYQAINLQGDPVDQSRNPIVITVNGKKVPAFDGSGDQSSGTYYRLVNLNYGEIQLVNEAGDPLQGISQATIAYSYATNVIKFNLDNPHDVDYEKYLNKLLQKVGAQKAMLSGTRFETPDFMLMSPTLNDTITNAEQFVISMKRDGTNTAATGDLARIKDVSVFGTNAPQTDMGDCRIIMGSRGTTAYTVVKPFATGELTEMMNGKGQPLGKKVAYGEEYNAIHTPNPISNRYTSIVVYSGQALSGRG